MYASVSMHTTIGANIPYTDEKKWQTGLSTWLKITDARAMSKTRRILLPEAQPYPIPHPNLTPVCPAKPASNLSLADVLGSTLSC